MSDAFANGARERIEQVVRELDRAGLNAWISSEEKDLSGAIVELNDPFGEAGVTVRWEPVELADEAADHVAMGKTDNPSITHLGVVCRSMQEAMMNILSSAGLSAIESPNDMDPYSVLVRWMPEHG